MTPQEFVEKWANTTLGERQTYQLHFSDVCQLVGHAPPDGSGKDRNGKLFVFEKYVKEKRGEGGYADVYYEDHFAIEYKAPNRHKSLDDAFKQLQRYHRQLKMPPLLIVTDIENWRIHTNFTSTVPETYEFTNSEISDRPEVFQWLKYIFENPGRFNPERNTKLVTEEAALALKAVVDNMRQRWNLSPQRVARFLTRIIFSLFAEDIGLLPAMLEGKGLFTYLVEHTKNNPENFSQDIGELFGKMEDGGRMHSRDIRWFNGALFRGVEVENLSPNAISQLLSACLLDWEYVEPAIFGTLFERCLDPDKRAQLGAHYTSPDDIMLIVEPVLMQPLRCEWAITQEKARPSRDKYRYAESVRAKEKAKSELLALRDQMLDRVRTTTVLDPACGSGNFLYISLQQLMNLELEIVTDVLWDDIDRASLRVSPKQLYGIEIDEIAHALSSIVVWIGYIQWREHHGYRYDEVPLLQDLSENIVCKDAILAFDEVGNPTEPDWPAVDVVVGNPPFLYGSKLRSELTDTYYEALTKLYSDRVPGRADLVCYWFEKAREYLENGSATRAGLLATSSIRGSANRDVLNRIKDTGDIFMAWSDRKWELPGASVRVSMIGFDNGKQKERTLDGIPAIVIHSDLTAAVDITIARRLHENGGLCFKGTDKGGKFDISEGFATQLLKADGKNADVVRPWVNARNLVRVRKKMWIIDFNQMTYEEAKEYCLPMEYVETKIKPNRITNAEKLSRERWWLHQRPRPNMRQAMLDRRISRYICTPRHSKYRIIVWLDTNILPDSANVAIVRDDDYFWGALHSKFHEKWALRMGTSLGPTPRNTQTTTFETFPFPWSPGSEDTSQPAHAAISRAAKQLHEERHAWLNPAGASEKEVKDRTLTNLYNALQVFRGLDTMKTKHAAANFAPRLDELHRALDEAVCDAYGWEYAILNDEENILRRLLALNLARAG